MPFDYVCDECGFKIHPRKRYETEKCRICGETVEPEYICRICGETLSMEELSKYSVCPNCEEPIPEERVETGHYKGVTMEDGKLTIEIEGWEFTSLEDIHEVSLNIFGVEIGRIENPDFAEFSSIENYEKTDDGVDLHFGPEENEELLKKIENVKKSKDKD